MIHARQFDPDIVKELFDYQDGKLIWKTRARSWFANKRGCSIWNVRYPGKEAGTVNSNGYVTVRLSILNFDSSFRASHLIWVWHYGQWPVEQLDHIDHMRSNDRIENLREVTNAENQRNRAPVKSPKSGRTRVFGVSLVDKLNTWRASISIDGYVLNLGTFGTEIEAAAARRAAELLLGYHTNHGRQAISPDLDHDPPKTFEVHVTQREC